MIGSGPFVCSVWTVMAIHAKTCHKTSSTQRHAHVLLDTCVCHFMASVFPSVAWLELLVADDLRVIGGHLLKFSRLVSEKYIY